MLTLTSPVETVFHKVAAGPKLAALCAATVVLFWLDALLPLTLALGAALALTALGGRVFLRHALRMLRPLIPFVAVVALWHLVTDDLARGGVILLRMGTAVMLANLVTMTTRLSDMIDVLTCAARPLRPVLNPATLALAIALTIRFIPTLSDRVGQIGLAWRARSPRRPGWRILTPATLAALDDAEQVAEALRARGGAG